ncbi:MAG: hypothetical protein IT423_12350, partial [Pirellulaceae bacterium]|nr:hypothetical protein [Pirellulaceae bacterium]
MKLNWTKPEAAGRISMADLRKQREEQLRERLGIASYTGLFSFLYVTRFEVRHEVLIPLLTLEQWLPIPRKDKNYLEVEEQAAAREAIEKFFREKNTVTINGEVVDARVTRLNFFSLDINDFALNAEPRRVNVAQARVGAILTFKSPMTPRAVQVKWDAYSEYAQFVQTVVLVDNQPPARHDFHSLEQTYQWSGDLLGAKVEPVQASGSQLPAEQRVGILEQVLSNIYRAFDFREDEQVYDALATSVDGALLRDLYLRIKRTLLMAEQGGALAHVTSVQVSNAQVASSGAKAVGRGAGDQKPGETLEVTWQVTGVAEHWGHVHTRVSEYRAKLSLRAIDGHWKLVGFQLLDEKRIKFETSIRGL